MVKSWCRAINLKGNYGSHTLRKTFGYHQRIQLNTGVPELMVMFNHSSQKQLMQKVKTRVASEGREVVVDTSNPQKMSEIIIDYAEPLLAIAATDKDQEKAVIMAITFWNLAILKENERQDMIDSLITNLMQAGDPADLNQTMEYFMERKQLLYPDVNRMILDYDCVHTTDRLHLNVVSNSIE